MSNSLRSLSVWSAITGLALVALLLIQLGAGRAAPPQLPMLLAAVVGFELFLFSRDVVGRVRRRG